MAFNNPNNSEKSPIISHLSLAKNGPKMVKVISGPKMVKNNTLCVVDLLIDGVKHGYFIDNEEIKAGFSKHIGQQVVLIASGNSRNGTAQMDFQSASSPTPQVQASGPVKLSSQPRPPSTNGVATPVADDLGAKKYLCQASNLMRLCVKKANDIAVELGLPKEHRQGIATTLFIQSDRRGFIDVMPLSAYTPEELGFGASKAESLADPQPQEDIDDQAF